MGAISSSVYGTHYARVSDATVDAGDAVADQGAVTSSQAAALTSSQEATADAGIVLTEVVTLSNSLKVKYNAAQVDLAALRTKYNAAQVDIASLRTKVNDLLTSLRAAGLLDT